MAVTPTVNSKAGLVNRNINTTYDIVKIVSDNINDVNTVANADLVSVIAAPALTAADVLSTAADLALTNADVLSTAADAALTAADVLSTAADLALTNQDTLDTAADLALTNADVTAASASATAANNSAIAANADKNTADGSAIAALASENTASKWAIELEDTLVDASQYSAFHWAKKAQAFAVGGLTYQGTWDASTTLYPTTPATNDFYIIDTVGVIMTISYVIGDRIIWNGTTWDSVFYTESINEALLLSTGTGNAYVIAAGVTSYIEGIVYSFRPHVDSLVGGFTVDFGAGASTVHREFINAAGVITTTTAAFLGTAKTNSECRIYYNGTNFILLNPQTTIIPFTPEVWDSSNTDKGTTYFEQTGNITIINGHTAFLRVRMSINILGATLIGTDEFTIGGFPAGVSAPNVYINPSLFIKNLSGFNGLVGGDSYRAYLNFSGGVTELKFDSIGSSTTGTNTAPLNISNLGNSLVIEILGTYLI